jgi:Ca-activated chloride channel family protein
MPTLIILLLSSPLLLAQGLIVPNEMIRPDFRPIELISQDVGCRIIDGTAQVTIQQVFRNTNSWQLEGTYVFPLPKDAVVSSFLLIQDGKEWAAELVEADEARRIYQQIVRQRRDPALLEYINQKMFRASIFPIPPGAERQIDLTYSQVLDSRNGLYVWGFPFPTGEKSFPHADLNFDVRLETRQALGNVYSPQAQVKLSQDDDHNAHAYFEGDFKDVTGPFQIYYSLADKHFGMNLLAHRDGEEGTFLLMISPQRDLEAQEIIGKDIVFVLDRSGSMRGEKLKQAKSALEYCLENLNDRDRFNIIEFSDAVRIFQNDLVSAGSHRRQGLRYVNRITSGGGTNLHDALRHAIAMDWNESRPRSIILLTDGLPTVGTTSLEAILDMASKKNKNDVRIFPFGVGHDVDAIFLDRLAQANRGATEYVEPQEDIETAVASFYNQIQHPVLADPHLEFQGIDVDMVYPTDLPDLFAGNQLLVLGRYRGHGEHAITLRGEVNGRERSIRHVMTFPRDELNSDFIDELWASRRIGFLLEEIRLHGEKSELKDEVIALSKEYGIATPYTSFLVTEDQQLAQNPPQRTDQWAAQSVGSVLKTLPGVHQDTEGEFHLRGGRSSQPLPSGTATDKKSGYVSLPQEMRMEEIQLSQAVRDLKETSSLEKSKDRKRHIAGRTFEKRGIEWVETSFADKDTTIDIKYGSKAYWDLVDEMPDLAGVFALGEKLVLKVGKVYVRIGDSGRETIARAEIKTWLKGA